MTAFGSSRLAGMMLPGNGSRTKPAGGHKPVTGSTWPAATLRVVAGSKTVPSGKVRPRTSGPRSALQRDQVREVREAAVALRAVGTVNPPVLRLPDDAALVVGEEERLVPVTIGPPPVKPNWFDRKRPCRRRACAGRSPPR